MGRLLTPDAYIKSIYSISPEGLKKEGIKGLILDIDNTLVPTYTRDADIRLKPLWIVLRKTASKQSLSQMQNRREWSSFAAILILIISTRL